MRFFSASVLYICHAKDFDASGRKSDKKRQKWDTACRVSRTTSKQTALSQVDTLPLIRGGLKSQFEGNNIIIRLINFIPISSAARLLWSFALLLSLYNPSNPRDDEDISANVTGQQVVNTKAPFSSLRLYLNDLRWSIIQVPLCLLRAVYKSNVTILLLANNFLKLKQ